MSRGAVLTFIAFALGACGNGNIGGVAADGSPTGATPQGSAKTSSPNGNSTPSETGTTGTSTASGPTSTSTASGSTSTSTAGTTNTEPAPQPAPGVTETFYATRTSCMAPCAVQLDAQQGASLTWPEVRDSEYVWDFDDGGSRTDSEGFLAAVVYEKAGTYHPTVTVDGETWNPQTITVLDPTRTVCVGTDFSDCPSANGADHFATISAAVTATNGEARRHILLERGGSYGTLPGGSGNSTLIGAYSSGNKPAVTASDLKLLSKLVLPRPGHRRQWR